MPIVNVMKKEETIEWLLEEMIRQEGSAESKKIIKLGMDKGHNERTIYRAKNKLGIKQITSGFGKDKKSIWILI
jgi:hypothetical protein